MVNKTIGYVIMGVGVLLFILPYSAVQTALKLAFLQKIPNIYLMIAGAVILIIGAYLGFGMKEKQPKEIPIYEGMGKERKVVAIQRLGK
jgi:predicted membrane channel-forming protein YqfA (hemolysin III family)